MNKFVTTMRWLAFLNKENARKMEMLRRSILVAAPIFSLSAHSPGFALAATHNLPGAANIREINEDICFSPKLANWQNSGSSENVPCLLP